MFASWELAQMVFWESLAEMALFCRSLTVENHLLSYQEMRPMGDGVATATTGSAERLSPGFDPLSAKRRRNSERRSSLEQRCVIITAMIIIRGCIPLKIVRPGMLGLLLCLSNPRSTALLRRNTSTRNRNQEKTIDLICLFLFLFLVSPISN
jgi:hypothetical protein